MGKAHKFSTNLIWIFHFCVFFRKTLYDYETRSETIISDILFCSYCLTERFLFSLLNYNIWIEKERNASIYNKSNRGGLTGCADRKSIDDRCEIADQPKTYGIMGRDRWVMIELMTDNDWWSIIISYYSDDDTVRNIPDRYSRNYLQSLWNTVVIPITFVP